MGIKQAYENKKESKAPSSIGKGVFDRVQNILILVLPLTPFIDWLELLKLALMYHSNFTLTVEKFACSFLSNRI